MTVTLAAGLMLQSTTAAIADEKAEVVQAAAREQASQPKESAAAEQGTAAEKQSEDGQAQTTLVQYTEQTEQSKSTESEQPTCENEENSEKKQDSTEQETAAAALIAEGSTLPEAVPLQTAADASTQGNAVPQNTEPITGEKTEEGVTLSLMAPEGSFPEGTSPRIAALNRTEKETLSEQLSERAGLSEAELLGFDISFTDANGENVQPEKDVRLTFTLAAGSAFLARAREAGALTLYHFGDAPEEVKTIPVEEDAESLTLTADVSAFSPYALTVPKRLPLGAPRRVNAVITKFELRDWENKDPVTELTIGAGFSLNIDWEVPETVHTGDFFDVEIPRKVNLTNGATIGDFDLLDKDGRTIARASVTRNSLSATSGGGNIHVVFLEDANNKYNLKGNMHLKAYFNQQAIKVNETHKIELKVNGGIVPADPSTVPSVIVKPNPLVKDILAKWGENLKGKPGVVKWVMRINQEGKNLKNVVIKDALQTNNGHYLPPSSLPEVQTTEQFKLQKVVYREDASIASWGEVVDISDKLVLSPDGKSFTLTLGDIGTQSYMLMYRTTLENGRVQQNNAVLTADNDI